MEKDHQPDKRTFGEKALPIFLRLINHPTPQQLAEAQAKWDAEHPAEHTLEQIIDNPVDSLSNIPNQE